MFYVCSTTYEASSKSYRAVPVVDERSAVRSASGNFREPVCCVTSTLFFSKNMHMRICDLQRRPHFNKPTAMKQWAGKGALSGICAVRGTGCH